MSERVEVVILHVSKGRQERTSSAGAIIGDGGSYYYLPGKNEHEVRATLEAAGFKRGNRFSDAVNGARGE